MLTGSVRPIDDVAPFRAGRLMSRLSVCLQILLVSAGCSSTQPQPFSIALEHQTSDTAARVVVSGLSSSEASALRGAGWDEAGWRPLLSVATAEQSSTPMAGRYRVDGTTVVFEPAFAFDAGREYVARFDPARLPVPRASAPLTLAISLPPPTTGPRVEVSAIYPSAGEWPENLLRFYIHFSGPMARGSGVGRVHLIDDTGEEVADALLPATVDFWSPDQTRYTVFFDPGRVKRGIRPNLELGRALVAGRDYTISVDASWRDAEGRPLERGFRKTFRAGPAREAALSLADWRVSSPRIGSRDPFVVNVPAPLDDALFRRTLGVAVGGDLVSGAVDVRTNETEWRFVPADPWRSGVHELVILSTLEDPAGNRINQPFEVAPSQASAAEEPDRFTLPIRLAYDAPQ